MKIVYSKACLEYSFSGHIESPQRVERAKKILEQYGYDFQNPTPADEADLLKVHTYKWVETVKNGKLYDADTPWDENIFKYASLSAGGAILAAKIGGFSLLRPPGHHAGIEGVAMGATTLGFCYFNNIAIAMRYLNKPGLILDIDGHHGNGTQEIFSGDPNVVYLSLHRSPHYPGTGLTSENNCLNYPLPAGIGNEGYLKTLDNALKQIDLSNIEVVGISAGFDAHEGDLASLGITGSGWREIGRRIKKLEKDTFGVLEGGYSGDIVANALHQLIQGVETS